MYICAVPVAEEIPNKDQHRMAPSVLVILRGEAFRRGDVNTRRTDSCTFETEQKVAQSAFTCVLMPLLTTGADVTVFVDAIFASERSHTL